MSCCGNTTFFLRNPNNQFPSGMQSPYTSQNQYHGGAMPTSQMLPLPTGLPTGPAPSQIPPAAVTPTTIGGTVAPQTVMSSQYIPGYLRTQIGQQVRVEFLIGTNGPLIDRIGTLVGVGASYILLRPQDSDDLLMADLYSIKFVTTYR